jgi:hypothetical protein
VATIEQNEEPLPQRGAVRSKNNMGVGKPKRLRTSLTSLLVSYIAIMLLVVALLMAGCASAGGAEQSSGTGESASASESAGQLDESSSSGSEDGENSGGFVVEDSATVSVEISDDEGEA